MINPDDAEIGSTVYPRPTTKQAPRECYLGLAAVLVSVAKWPMVTVRIFDSPDNPRGREIDLHRDNVGLRRKTEKKSKQGDMTGNESDPGAGMVGKPIGRPIPQIDPESGYEEPVLF